MTYFREVINNYQNSGVTIGTEKVCDEIRQMGPGMLRNWYGFQKTSREFKVCFGLNTHTARFIIHSNIII